MKNIFFEANMKHRFITLLITLLVLLFSHSVSFAGGSYTMSVGEQKMLSFTPKSGSLSNTMVWNSNSSAVSIDGPQYGSYTYITVREYSESRVLVWCDYKYMWNGLYLSAREDFFISIKESHPTGISIISSLTLHPGDRYTITPDITPSGAKTDLSWRTSNASVANVTSNGTVIANTEGSARITVSTDNGYSASCDVVVVKPTVKLSVNNKNALVETGTEITLSASPSTADIYYTIDGTSPTKSSIKYTGPIVLDKDLTIKAIAIKDGYYDSSILMQSYRVSSLKVIEKYPTTEEEIWRDKLIPVFVFNKNICQGRFYDKISFTDVENNSVPGEIILNWNQLFFKPDAQLAVGKYNFNIPQEAIESEDGEPNFSASLDVNIKGTSRVVKAVCHTQTSFVVKDDGSLWSAGYYKHNELGYESDDNVKILTKVLDNITDISVNNPSMALTNSGEVYQWGYTYGLPDTESNVYPKLILKDAISICQGYSISYAILSDHSLWAWGNNQYGQLGNGTRESVSAPVKIMDNVSQVRAHRHTLVIKQDGSLWGWGINSDGQLGIGSTDTIIAPVKIMDGIKDVSIVNNSSYILDDRGQLFACGDNNSGQIGNGTTADCLYPVKILDDVKYIPHASHHFIFRFYAIKNDGTLWGWGNNYGLLGDGTTTQRNKPVKILEDVKFVALGWAHAYAIKEDKTLWGWGGVKGDDPVGIGDGTVFSRARPQKVLDNVDDITIGQGGSMMAITTGGELYAWGNNGQGECAVGKYGNILSPVKICSMPPKVEPESILFSDMSIHANDYALAIPKLVPVNADYKSIVWKSDDPRIAWSTPEGIIYGFKVGETIIRVKITDYDGTEHNAMFRVKVDPELAYSILLNEFFVELKVGETVQLVASVLPESCGSQLIDWKSSDDNVLTVDNSGKVTANNLGIATVTATTTDGSKISDSCKISVIEASGLADVRTNGPSVYVRDGNIFIENVSTGSIIRIYTIDGLEVLRTASEGMPIVYNCGRNMLYIVTIDNNAYKVSTAK